MKCKRTQNCGWVLMSPTLLEDHLLFGSDMGFTIQKTISSSSLGPCFKEKNCKYIVNTFHGYSHNWECQKVPIGGTGKPRQIDNDDHKRIVH